MKTVGTFEAKTHLSALLDAVAKGERIRITRHGEPVAMLVPAEEAEGQDREDAIRKIEQFSKGRHLKGVSIRELINEGRRH
jgi:prevent-host-death family protein